MRLKGHTTLQFEPSAQRRTKLHPLETSFKVYTY